MKIVKSLAVLVCVFCLASVIFAGNECPGWGCPTGMKKDKGGFKHGGHGILGVLEELALTDGQKAKIAEIENKHAETTKTLAEKMKGLMKSGEDKNDEINALKAEMNELRKSIKNEVDSILTDEQKNKLEQKREQIRNQLRIKKQNKDYEGKTEKAE